MKQAYTLILISLLLLSCEDTDKTLFEGPYHVRFSEPSSEISENFSDPFGQNLNEPLSIRVHLVAPGIEGTTSIRFEVSGTAVENMDYVILDNELKRLLIPAGQFFDEILIKPINNRENAGNKQIVFTLTEVTNDLDLGFGFNGAVGRTHEVTIREDDCLVDIRKFEGVWEFNQNNDEFIYEVIVAVDYSENNRLVFANFTGLDSAVTAFANLDMCTREIIIPEQFLGGFNNQIGMTRSDGKGSFDQNIESMTFSYSYDLVGPSVKLIRATKKDEE
jgi:hypothetical protein